MEPLPTYILLESVFSLVRSFMLSFIFCLEIIILVFLSQGPQLQIFQLNTDGAYSMSTFCRGHMSLNGFAPVSLPPSVLRQFMRPLLSSQHYFIKKPQTAVTVNSTLKPSPSKHQGKIHPLLYLA